MKSVMEQKKLSEIKRGTENGKAKATKHISRVLTTIICQLFGISERLTALSAMKN
jgi:hypothetical protein